MQLKRAIASILPIDLRINQLYNRIDSLEESRCKAKQRTRATEAQRFLIAFYLGQLDTIIQEPNSQKQKHITISIMLDIDVDNARLFLSEIPKKEKKRLHTISNYTFLVQFFKDNDYEKQQQEADRILTQLLNQKEKKTN
jgi:hypothetical protein